MQARVLLLFLLLLSFLEGSSQSVYTFRYNFSNQQDSIIYNAFLLRNDDGSGLLRIRFNNNKGENILAESYIDEQIPANTSGEPDTTLLLVKALKPSVLLGDARTVFTIPVFIFRNNPLSGFFEPAGVTTEKTTDNNHNSGTVFTWNFLEGSTLDRKTVSRFFNEDDNFYINLFRNTTRGLSATEKKIKMHLLIVADTNDKRVGKSAILDIKKVSQTFGSICDYLGIKLLADTVYGKRYSKTNVQAAITKLRKTVTPEDIVIFYYTGHGFRIPEKPREYPNIKLKNFIVPRPTAFKAQRDSLVWVKKERDANIANTMNMEDIYNSIQRIGARFNLVISDCCNDDIFSANIEGIKPSKTKGSGIQWDEANIRSLFLSKTPMSLLVSAAQEGQRATSKNDYGGFFTDFFNRSLENHCSKLRANVTWDLVLTQAKTQTTTNVKGNYCATPRIPENACKQNPVSKIKIGR